MRPRLIIIGASHAARLVKALKNPKLQDIEDHYDVFEITKPGSNIQDLIPDLPDPTFLRKSDIVIAQLFGNSLFEKHLKVERFQGGQKLFHLTKVVFRPVEKLEKEWCIARKYFDKCPARVLLIDNPYRHISCCEKHERGGLIPIFQKKMNKELTRYFQTPNITVLDHRHLSQFTRYVRRYHQQYRSHQPDAVHFVPQVYHKWWLSLKKHLLVSGSSDGVTARTELAGKKGVTGNTGN